MAGLVYLWAEWTESTITKRDHGRLMNDSMRDMGLAHKSRHLKKHFDDTPENRVGGAYNIVPRSIKWQRRKAREGKPKTANVYSGATRDTITRASVVRATQYRATVQVKNHFAMKDSQRAELEAVSGQEREWLAKRCLKTYTQRASLPAYQRKRKIVIKP